MMKRILGLVLILALAEVAGAFTFSGNYTGSGGFRSRIVADGDMFDTRGDDGTIEMGAMAGNGISWIGYNFYGSGGRFEMAGYSGPLHSARILAASVIEAQGQIDDEKSWIELAGNGTFSESVYEMGDRGRLDKVMEIDFTGAITMDSVIYNDTEIEVDTVEITEADMTTTAGGG
jgi:hypothetical protein